MIQNKIHCYTKDGWQCTFDQQDEFLSINTTDPWGRKKSYQSPCVDEVMKKVETISLNNDRFGIHVFEKKEGSVILLGRVGLLGGGFWGGVGRVCIVMAGAGFVAGGLTIVIMSGGAATPLVAAAASAAGTGLASAGVSVAQYGLTTSSEDISAGDLAYQATTSAVAGAASSAVSSAGGFATGRAVAAVSNSTGKDSFSTRATQQIGSGVVRTASSATAAVIAPDAAGVTAAMPSAIVQQDFEARGRKSYRADLRARQSEASSQIPRENDKAASSASRSEAEIPKPKPPESPAKVTPKNSPPSDNSPKDFSKPDNTENTPDKKSSASTKRNHRSAQNKSPSSGTGGEASNPESARSDSRGLSAPPATPASDQQDSSAYRQLESALHGRPELLKTLEFAKSKNLHNNPEFSQMLNELGRSEDNKLTPELLGKLAELEVQRLATTTAEPSAHIIEQRLIDSVQEGETLKLRGELFQKEDNALYRLNRHRKRDYSTYNSFSDKIRTLIDEFLRTENEIVDRRQRELENEYGNFLEGEGL